MPLAQKLEELAMFSGTSEYHRWSFLFRNLVLTDGAKFVAEHGGGAGAYWLMDAIASHQPLALRDKMLAEFQVWQLRVADDQSAVLTCWADTGSGEKPKITQKIEWTDFDLPELDLYCLPLSENPRERVILLKSEY